MKARPQSTLDLVANLALAGAAATILVRPAVVARLARSPVVPEARNLARRAVQRQRPPPAPPPSPLQELARLAHRYSHAERRRRRELTKTAGRRLNGSAAMLAFSVLADSAIEHYRGSFHNRAMYVPLAVSALTLGGSLFGVADARPQKQLARDVVYASAAATAFAGLGFHFYNILKRPGGWSWLNLFYSAPIGAPMALALAGLLGRGAERVRETPTVARAKVLGLPAGRMLAGVTAAGLAGTVGEAGLLHFRGAYHNPAMFVPVSVPPLASILIGAAAIRPSGLRSRIARWWLSLTAFLGFAGVGFHAYGVARNMGGWRNWSQNVLNGPPLPAPPSFTGLALAGLAALSLIDEESQEKKMPERYPGYDVLNKRNSVSWNDKTREVIDSRLAIDPNRHLFFTDEEWPTVRAVCDRIVPQTVARLRPVPLAAMLDDKLHKNGGDGYRYAELLPMREAWRRGLAALDAEAKDRHRRRFHDLGPLEQDKILKAVQHGAVRERTWHDLPAQSFFKKRVLHDIVSLYYSHPTSWNEIGFGGPASPRGYVRMNYDRRDPWEAAEAKPGREAQARRENTRVG